MSTRKGSTKKFQDGRLHEESGAGLIEYALLVSLVALAGLSGIKALGANTSISLNSAGQTLAGDITPHDGCDSSHPDFPDC